jgi:hypothetical protein
VAKPAFLKQAPMPYYNDTSLLPLVSFLTLHIGNPVAAVRCDGVGINDSSTYPSSTILTHENLLNCGLHKSTE